MKRGRPSTFDAIARQRAAQAAARRSFSDLNSAAGLHTGSGAEPPELATETVANVSKFGVPGTPASNTGVPGATLPKSYVTLPPVVDTLYLSLDSTCLDIVSEAEHRSKSVSLSNADSGSTETSRWTLGMGSLRGHTAYEFIARGRGVMAGIQVLWGRQSDGNEHPTARRFKVLIGSEVLWRNYSQGGSASSTAAAVLAQLEGDLFLQLPPIEKIRVRRIDAAVDHCGYRWTQRDLQRFACRQQVRGVDETNNQVEGLPDQVSTFHGPTSATYYVGSRGSAARFLRVYDKIAEGRKSGKLPWMEPLWKQHGWDGKATIWRAEIEHGGEWLKAHGLGTLDNLDGCEHALWLKYLEDVRHTVDSRSRLKRCQTSPVWKRIGRSVAAAAKAGPRSPWVWHPRPPSEGGDMKVLTQMAAGCMRKLRAAMFREPERIAQLHTFMDEAMRRGEVREQERQRRQAMNGRRAPPKRTKEKIA